MRKWILYIILGIMVVHLSSATIIDSFEREWNILAIGDEYTLLKGITYKNINSTATMFYIDYQIDYKETIDAQSLLSTKDITSVPVEKTTYSKTVSLDKTSLDLSKDNSILIQYTEGEDASFKIGWNSVLVDSSASIDATELNGNKNILRDYNDRLHIAYEASGDDLWYGYSDNNGTTWTKKELLSDTIKNVNILIQSNGTLQILYGDTSSEDVIDGMYSDDNGSTWNSFNAFSISGLDIQYPTCVLDKHDIIHCCFIDEDDKLYYGNSTNWNNEIIVNDNIADDSDTCDIEVNSNDCIYIVASGTEEDTVDIWSPCLNGWGDTNRVEIYDTGGSALTFPTIISENVYDELYVSFIEASDLQFCSSSNQGNIWSCKELDPVSSDTPDIFITEDKTIGIVYNIGDNDVAYANSSDRGISWSIRDDFDTQEDYPSIAHSTYPIDVNKITNRLDILSGDALYSNLHYANKTINYIPADITPPIIFNLRNTDTTYKSSYIEWNCDEKCNYTISWGIGSINNNTFKTSHNPFLNNLQPNTTYSIGLDVWDISGNNGYNYTFSFNTSYFLTNITVQLPNGITQVEFTALNKSHKYVEPNGQTDLIPFFNITNIGTASLNVTHLLNQTLPSDVVYMVNDEYVTAEAMPIFDYLQTVHSPLLPNESIGIWLWTNFTNSLPQTINRQGNISVYNNT